MKTIFNLFPTGDKHDLLVEAGNDDFSFLFYEKDSKKVNGALLYEINPTAQPDKELPNSLENILSNNPFIQNTHSVTILYNVAETTLIPMEYDDGYAHDEYLNLLYGKSVHTQVLADKLDHENMVQVYRVKNQVANTLKKFFPQAKYCHSGSLQLQLLNPKADTIHCMVQSHRVKIIFYKNGRLQLMQFYSYGTAADLLYCLLNICTQHDVEPSSLNLVLYGLIDQNSNLYKEIYNYFLHVEMATLPGSVTLSEEISQNPSHFFAHLIIPALCE